MKLKARAALAALLALLVAAPVVATAGWFFDVPTDHKYAEAINWVRQEKVFLGYPGNEFRPDKEFTPNQFDTVLQRLLNRYDGLTKRRGRCVLLLRADRFGTSRFRVATATRCRQRRGLPCSATRLYGTAYRRVGSDRPGDWWNLFQLYDTLHQTAEGVCSDMRHLQLCVSQNQFCFG